MAVEIEAATRPSFTSGCVCKLLAHSLSAPGAHVAAGAGVDCVVSAIVSTAEYEHGVSPETHAAVVGGGALGAVPLLRCVCNCVRKAARPIANPLGTVAAARSKVTARCTASEDASKATPIMNASIARNSVRIKYIANRYVRVGHGAGVESGSLPHVVTRLPGAGALGTATSVLVSVAVPRFSGY